MPMFCVRWPDGDFSVCEARNREDAANRFDEFGCVQACDVHLFKDFMAHFTIGEEGLLELAEFGESTTDNVNKYYPLLDRFLIDHCGLIDPHAIPEFQLDLIDIVLKERDREVKWAGEASVGCNARLATEAALERKQKLLHELGVGSVPSTNPV